MKLFFVAQHDFACSGTLFSLALASVGHETKALVCHNSPFVYPWEPEALTGVPQLKEWVEWADVVFMIQGSRVGKRDSNLLEESTGIITSKPTVMLYGGSAYRHHSKEFNQTWAPSSIGTIIYTGDLLGLGAPNEHLILPPVDLEYFKPATERRAGKLVVGHFPSSVYSKGTRQLWPILTEAEKEGALEARGPDFVGRGARRYRRVGLRQVLWQEQLGRLRGVDVVVDQIKARLRGKKFGEWMSCSQEAAALSRVVVANSHTADRYEKVYGEKPGILLCNDVSQLRRTLQPFIESARGDGEALMAKQRETRAWVERCHSFERTARLVEERILA